MPNTNVFRGSDASLVLAVDDTGVVEGKLADALIGEYQFASEVGRLTGVRISVTNELKPYHELGRRFASELRPGNITITGSADRAHINGAMLRLLLGDGAKSPPPNGGMAQPAFNLVINLANPATPGSTNKLVLFGVKFSSWSFSLPEDDFVMEAVTFQAIRISSEEVTA